MLAAILALREAQPARIVVAVPVASPDTCESLRPVADAVVCAMTLDPFETVGRWYSHFEQTTDGEVHERLARSRAQRRAEAQESGAASV